MEHEQHGLRARLLVLLLSLSNSDQVRQQEDAGSDEDNENIKIYEIIHNPRLNSSDSFTNSVTTKFFNKK